MDASTGDTVRTDQPFRFLDLPAELRVQIYEYLVVVGKVFFTPDHYEVTECSPRFRDWDKFAVPSLQILGTCKQIQQEAEAVYFEENLFVLPVLIYIVEPLNVYTPVTARRHPTGRGRPLFSNSALASMKKIGISYCNRSLGPSAMQNSDWNSHKENGHTPFDDLTQAQRVVMAHSRAISHLEDHWEDYSEALGFIHTKLQVLEIDISNVFCPTGCCRQLGMDLSFISDLAPQTIRLLGVRKGEAEVIKSRIAYWTECKIEELEEKYVFEIDPQDDAW